jgi:F-type H+-transporting ATPase subunit delta
MTNPRLAGRYAKSLIDLALEQNSLDAVYADMKFIGYICRSNPDFVNLLRSPIITNDKKEKVIESVVQESISKLTSMFLRLLVRKARENYLPEISEAFITQYNKLKDIHKVKLTTAVPMSNELHEAIIAKIRSNTPIQNIELETVVKDELIGGFKLQIGDVLIDASIQRDLHDIGMQFKSNEYLQKIR